MIYGSEKWFMTPYIGGMEMDRFHHRVARRLIVSQPRRGQDVFWVNPLLEDAMEEAVL